MLKNLAKPFRRSRPSSCILFSATLSAPPARERDLGNDFGRRFPENVARSNPLPDTEQIIMPQLLNGQTYDNN